MSDMGGGIFGHFLIQYLNAAHFWHLLYKSVLLLVVFLLLQVTKCLKLTLMRYSILCSLAPLHGRGQ